MSRKASILIVDDDTSLCALAKEVLDTEGYVVHFAHSLFQAEGVLSRGIPDLLILDRQLPDGDGLSLCEKLKANSQTQAVPVLFLSATRKTPSERVVGFGAGGDDYLLKPFHAPELLARVKALLHRSSLLPEAARTLSSGPLTIDLDAHKAMLHGKEVALWPKEYYLLCTLVAQPDKVFSRQSLLRLIWGPGKDMHLTHKVVDVTVSNLKKKLGKLADRIVTVRGTGFRFDSQR